MICACLLLLVCDLKIDATGLQGLAVQIEPAVVERTLRALVGQRALRLVACTCTLLHTLALVAAEAFIKLSISCHTCPVCKWRRDYPARMAPLEAHHMANASRYIGRIAGRYQLSSTTALDVRPDGSFVNYSPSYPSPDAEGIFLGLTAHAHCFEGMCTVAAVRGWDECHGDLHGPTAECNDGDSITTLPATVYSLDRYIQ